MRFGNLLKKELKELLNPQTIFTMVFMLVLLMSMGKFLGGAMEEAFNVSEVSVYDLDGSEFTKEMLASMEQYGTKPKLIEDSSEDYAAVLEKNGIKSMTVIPAGFGEAVANGTEAKVEMISNITSIDMASTMGGLAVSSIVVNINDYVRKYIGSAQLDLSDEDMARLAAPVITAEYTSANGKTVSVPAEALSAMLMQQGMIAPLAVFFLLMMASQTIMTAISTEKIDKTLETLMSAPVSRVSVLTAKMTAALIVALMNAASMIIGMLYYMSSMMSGAAAEEISSADISELTSVAEAITDLGLTLTPVQMLFFGAELFVTIAIGLCAALVLGATATDVKSVQTLTLPIMIVAMVPFFAVMFTNMNELPLVIKAILYIIPFTHTYTAMSDLMFGNTVFFWAGFAYQLLFLVGAMFIAVKMFTTDRLFTMSLTLVKDRKNGKEHSDENA